MDNPLQNIQDTVSKQWLEESEYGYEYSQNQTYQCINMVPMFVRESYQVYGRPNMTAYKKRPPIQWNYSFTGLVPSCAVLDVVAISSLYNNIITAVYHSTSVYIIAHNVATNVSQLLGSFAFSGSPFVWLSEISQASAGSTYPGFAVNVMDAAYTTSKSFYSFTTNGGTSWSALTQITDVHYPNQQTPALITIGKIVNFNDTFFVATLDGRIWNSPAGGRDISVWSNSYGTGSINVSAYPDQCLGVERYKQHIVAFGSNSIEFFDYDTSVLPTALARLEQAFIKTGVVNPKLYSNFDDVIYWVGYSSSNAIGLWKLDGYTPQKISNTGIDQTLANSFVAANVNTAFSCGTFRGKKCVVFGNITLSLQFLRGFGGIINTFGLQKGIDSLTHTPTSGTLCYSIDDNLWWVYTSPGNIWASSFMVVPAFNVAGVNSGVPNNQFVFYTNSTFSETPAQAAVYQLQEPAFAGTTKFLDTYDPALAIPEGQQNFWIQLNTNPTRFGNNKYKRVDQFTLVRESYYTSPSWSLTGTYGAMLFATREAMNLDPFLIPGPTYTSPYGSLPNGMSAQGFVFPPTSAAQSRMTFNRLGSGRTWSFTYIEASPADFVTYGYDLNIQQLQH